MAEFDSGTGAHQEGVSTSATGNGAHAEGVGSVADGQGTHAEGQYTVASGPGGAHAEGSTSQALGYGAHAEGSGTIAAESDTHAEGNWTQALAPYSHSEGTYTRARGESSHVEGEESESIGLRSHAQGHDTRAFGEVSDSSGEFSYAMGKASRAGGITCTAVGIASTSEGSSNSSSRTPDPFSCSIGGTKLIIGGDATDRYHDGEIVAIFAGGLAYLRTINTVEIHRPTYGLEYYVGCTTSFNIDSPIDGSSSSGTVVSTAQAMYSHSEGNATRAAAQQAHAEGSGTLVLGDSGHAQGQTTAVYGPGGHAEGQNTAAAGPNSHAEGSGSVAGCAPDLFGCPATSYTITIDGDVRSKYSNGDYVLIIADVTEIRQLTEEPSYNPTPPESTTLTLNDVIDMASTGGYVINVTKGARAHAEGSGTTARGENSHAQGSNCLASGANSFAAGENCIAAGISSSAVGASCTATGDRSAAAGLMAHALRLSQYSHAGGSFDEIPGQAQSSQLELRCISTDGGGRTANLFFGEEGSAQELALEDGRLYEIQVRCVATECAAPGGRAMWIHDLLVEQEGGVISILNDNLTLDVPLATGWTFAISTAAGPVLRMTLDTTPTSNDVRALATVRFGEVSRLSS